MTAAALSGAGIARLLQRVWSGARVGRPDAVPAGLDAGAPLSADAPGDAVDLCPDAVLVLDEHGVVTRCNAASEQLMGRERDEILGHPVTSFIARSDRDLFRDRFTGARERGDATPRFDVRLKGAAQRIVSVALGAGWGVVVLTARDVSDEREAIATLSRSESRYRQLFESASSAIMTFDHFGRFTTVNGAAQHISGYTREELIGRFFGPLLAPESLPRALIEFRRALSGAAGQLETIMIHRNGERRNLTVNYACPERSREVICMIRDATVEKQLQQQLIQSEKMAAIGQLVSGVAHELNNPLASISAFAQLSLADQKLSPEQRANVDVIVSEARRAARIVHNLLTFARQHRAEKVAADVNQVIRETLELRAYELRVRGIALEYQLDARTAPVTMVDVHQLQQVALNLITNAEQAMAEIERESHRMTIRTLTLPDVVRIEVEDTGPGIPADVMHQIFNPFFTTKPVGKGTGLGLSISVGIISEHGGRIWANNLPGGGARFTVELPRTERPVAPLEASTPVPSGPAPRRVLLADDEASLRVALDRFLSSRGHQVVTVASGSEAIRRAEGEEAFDVIFLDLRMPDVSGQQVFDRWRKERRDLCDRVVFLTGDTTSQDAQRYLEATGRPYRAKPFEFGEILDVLSRSND